MLWTKVQKKSKCSENSFNKRKLFSFSSISKEKLYNLKVFALISSLHLKLKIIFYNLWKTWWSVKNEAEDNFSSFQLQSLLTENSFFDVEFCIFNYQNFSFPSSRLYRLSLLSLPNAPRICRKSSFFKWNKWFFSSSAFLARKNNFSS